jgi:uncharacterized protein (DUF1330 family)/hemerythrin superfamily protein
MEKAMVAYLIVHRREIADSQMLKSYAAGIDQTIARFGGKVVVRSDSFEALEGGWHPGLSNTDALPERITVVEFPTMAALRDWYDSADYAALKALRQRSSTSDIIAVEGNSSDRRSWLRDVAAFGAGAALTLLATRVAPPFAGRLAGTLRGAAGSDPFEALADDHRALLTLFDVIERTDPSSRAQRATLLFQLKRMLGAHALAEEDVIYPMLSNDAGRGEESARLYREHAEMKIHLFDLEHLTNDDPQWVEKLRALRRIIADHARIEEEVEFPALRAALSETTSAQLFGDLQREKSLLL